MKAVLTRALALVGFSLLIVLSLSRVSFAMSLETIRDAKVMISLDGSTAKEGDTILVSDQNGKKSAYIRVQQVKGSKAIANIIKGRLSKPPQSYVLQPYVAGTRSAPPSAWGLLAGYNNTQMTVKLATVSVDMAGSGMSLEGFYERQVAGSFQMLARGGYQTLKTKGTTTGGNCQGSDNCSTEISYLGFDGLVKYSFFTSKITYWMAGGLGFSYAMSKTSNILDVSKISINQKILADLGLNWYLSRKSYIPIQLEYAMFPSNNVVSSSQMVVRLGYGQTF
jgi:hypothetical protein